jgi:FtsZ-binding cell division protein ZapB
LLFDKLAGAKTEALQQLHAEVEPLKQKSQQFETARANLQKTQKDVDQMVSWMSERYYWADVLSELRGIMIKVEGGMKGKLRTDSGIWIEQFVSAAPRGDVEMTAQPGEPAPEKARSEVQAAADEAFRKRYGLTRSTRPAEPTAEATPTLDTGTPARKKKAGPNEIASVTITFRAVSLASLSPEANKEIVYSMLNEIKSSPLFDPDWTDPDGKGIGTEEPPGTFTFGITVGLKRPFKL